MPGEFEGNVCVGGVVFRGEAGASSSKGTDLGKRDQGEKSHFCARVRSDTGYI